MQIKYSFKKEWLHFLRTFRFGGMLICIFSFAAANPLLYKALYALAKYMADSGLTQEAASAGVDVELLATASADAGAVFCGTLVEFCATSFLVIMLLLMQPFGGEQKKRATVIPFCSGLRYKSYLIPKFVLYPSVMFVGNFLGGCASGILCNALFTEGTVSAGTILFGSLIAAIYSVFVLSIYMTLGLCTGRPGIMVIVMYLGQTLLQQFFMCMRLISFNPFTLYFAVSSRVILAEDFAQSDLISIIVGAVLALVIAFVMYIIAVASLKAKVINNRDNKPEF